VRATGEAVSTAIEHAYVDGQTEPAFGLLAHHRAEFRQCFLEVTVDYNKVEALSLQGIVDFVGFQSNMEEWFSVADVTVLPSFYEGLPLSAIESLAAATPVVASAVDGTPEIVIHGRTGLTVPPGAPDELASAICVLLADPELRARFGGAGRAWVEEEFSQEKQIKRTEDLYLSSLERVRTERLQQMFGSQPVGPREVQLVEKAG